MSALSIQPTFPVFTDIDGQPLEAGYIFIGAANLNPQTNPIAVFFDAALTIAAPQPIRTLAGYPANSGTPARLYVNSDYSIQVQNKNGSVVYSAPTATERYSDVVVSGVNAEDVIYDPPFLGGVQTNVEAKLAQTVSVKDFGAVGDGTTDDTVPIQAAIDFALNTPILFPFNQSKPAVYFPAGRYRTTANLVVATTPVRGFGITLYGDGRYASILSADTGVTKILEFAGTPSDSQAEAVVDSLGFWGNDIAEHCIFGASLSGSKFNNLQLRGSTITAIRIGLSYGTQFQHLQVIDNLGDGISLFGATLDLPGQANGVVLIDCAMFLNEGFGLVIDTSSATKLIGCIIETNKKGGIYSQVGTRSLSVDGCYFEGNGEVGFTFTSPVTTVVKANILINGSSNPAAPAAATTTNLEVVNCYTKQNGSPAYPEYFIYGPGVASLVAENNISGDVNAMSFLGYFGQNSTSNFPSFGRPKFLRIGQNFDFLKTFEVSPIGGASLNYTDSALNSVIREVEYSNALPFDLSQWGFLSGATGTWQRSATTFSLNPSAPVWEVAYLSAGSSSVLGFTVNAADYPYFHNKLIVFSAYVKDLGNGTNAASLWVNGTDLSPALSSNSNWRFICGAFTFPVSGTLQFGLRKIGSSSSVQIAAPVFCEFGADIKTLVSDYQKTTQFVFAGVPTVGTWKRGDIVWEASPSAGGIPGYVCVTAGAPGTWKAMANLAA